MRMNSADNESLARGLLPSSWPEHRCSRGFECHSTIIIAARVMYHVIVHGDSGPGLARTEEDAATTFPRYPDPGLVGHLSLFVGQRRGGG